MSRGNSLKIIWGFDLIVFGIVLACQLFVDKFNFNDYWMLFLVLPSLADLIMNKGDVFNISLFIMSTSVFSYFIFNTIWACLIVLVILLGVLLISSKFIMRKKEVEIKNDNGIFK